MLVAICVWEEELQIQRCGDPILFIEKTGAKRGTTFVGAKYDLETSEKRKKKKYLTIQMVKYVASDPTPPQPQQPPVITPVDNFLPPPY